MILNKVIGVSAPRCGSTYILSTLAMLNNDIEPTHIYLEEPFFSRSPEVIKFDKFNNISFINEFELSDNNYLNDSKQFLRLYYDFNSNHNFDLFNSLLNCNHGYTLKIPTHKLYGFNLRAISELLKNENITKILIYRSNILDSILSMISVTKTNVWNSKDDISKRKRPSINYQSGEFDTLFHFMYKSFMILIQYYKSYDWDYVLNYDDLAGNPTDDFFSLYEDKVLRNIGDNFFKKLYKGDMKILNFEEMKTDIKQIGKEYGFDDFCFPISRSDKLK